MNRLALVARQAGTAAAFVPVVERLGASPLVFAYPPAAETFRQAGVRATEISGFDDACAEIEDARLATLLTGTSLSVDDDARWWAWARERSVRSIGFVDQWSNLTERFLPPVQDGLADVAPDVVAVPDDVVAAQYIAAGLPASRVAVVGSPAFDQLGRYDLAEASELRRRWRDEGSGKPVVVAIGEPPTPPSTYDEWRGRYGFTEIDMVELLDSIVGRVSVRFRPHPLHAIIGLPPELAHLPSAAGEKAAVLRAGDAVVGMSSMLLREAASIGRPTFSLRLGVREPSLLVDSCPAIVTLVDPAAALSSLSSIEADQAVIGPPRASHQHTDRFIAALALS